MTEIDSEARDDQGSDHQLSDPGAGLIVEAPLSGSIGAALLAKKGYSGDSTILRQRVYPGPREFQFTPLQEEPPRARLNTEILE